MTKRNVLACVAAALLIAAAAVFVHQATDPAATSAPSDVRSTAPTAAGATSTVDRVGPLPAPEEVQRSTARPAPVTPTSAVATARKRHLVAEPATQGNGQSSRAGEDAGALAAAQASRRKLLRQTIERLEAKAASSDNPAQAALMRRRIEALSNR